MLKILKYLVANGTVKRAKTAAEYIVVRLASRPDGLVRNGKSFEIAED